MLDLNQFSEKYLEISIGGGFQTPAFRATQKNANKKKKEYIERFFNEKYISLNPQLPM
jgi:hypothetical protein